MLTESLNSAGFVCQTLQRPPATILRTAEKLGIKPVVMINGIAHFSDHQVETLRRHFADADSPQAKQ